MNMFRYDPDGCWHVQTWLPLHPSDGHPHQLIHRRRWHPRPHQPDQAHSGSQVGVEGCDFQL